MRVLTCAIFIAATIGFLAGTSFSEDPAPSEKEQMEAFMKAMEALGTPGGEHKILAGMAGEWDADVKMWGMGQEEQSKGASSSKMVFKGRFLQTSYEGTMHGKPYRGVGMMGFDNLKKHYHMSWYDNGSTAAYTMTGTGSDDGKVLTLTGMWEGPGGMKMNTKFVYTLKDADTFTMEHYTVNGGKETRDMIMTYTRKKAAAKPAAAARRAGRACCPPGYVGPGY